MSTTTELEPVLGQPIPLFNHRQQHRENDNNATPDLILPNINTQNSSSLPPADRGKAAWLFLAGSFMIEALTWGFPFSFGVFQEYYTNHEPFSSKPHGIAAIGTTSSGLMYLSAPLVFRTLSRYPKLRRPASVTGLTIVIISMIGASFAHTVTQLLVTQGVLYAVGGGLLYSPCILYLDEWFVQRKSTAYGVMWAGTGLAGLVLPLVFNAGLQRFGHATVLRAWAVALMILAGPLLYFVRPRLPVSQNARSKRLDLKFLKTNIFWYLQIGNIVQGLGFFIPSIYLPSYAATIGLSSFVGSLSVSLMNASAILGQIHLGHLGDRLHVTSVVGISALGSSISVFLLWGLSSSAALLFIFSLMYGYFAGGFTSTYSGSMEEVSKRTPTDKFVIFGILAGGRGIGNVVAGPLSEKMLQLYDGHGHTAYGTPYRSLVIFTGVTAALSSIGWLGWRTQTLFSKR